MKRNILIAIGIILIFVAVKLFFNIILNNVLIVGMYDKGIYNEGLSKISTYINFSERYIANYNYANILYKKGEYESAIEQYKNALDGIIPKYKECDIRINYVLSICKTVKLNESNQESIEEAINTYQSAIDILTEKGCANVNNNNGHNKESEQLKRDIQDEINRLKNLLEAEKEKKEEEESESNKEQKEDQTSKKSETIEQKIKEIKENATEDQRDTEDLYKSYKKEYNRQSKNW